jgi:hypothetical protein
MPRAGRHVTLNRSGRSPASLDGAHGEPTELEERRAAWASAGDRPAVARAYAECEAIARERLHATSSGAYTDGYRRAAKEISEAIRRKYDGRALTELERDLRDVEIEARTLARVVAVAVDIVAHVGPDSSGAKAVRSLLGAFFLDRDLPPCLRSRVLCESTTSLIAPCKDIA